MKNKADVWQGTLALMVLKTLETMGSMHGYGIARRIEQTSAHHLTVNYGTIYPALLKLEQEGYIVSSWGCPRTTARQSSTSSLAPGRNSSRKKRGSGADDRHHRAVLLARRIVMTRRFHAAWLWLRGLATRGGRADLDLQAEIDCHLQMHIEDNLRAGMPYEQARRLALVKLGGLMAVREEAREVRAGARLEQIVHDIRQGARLLWRTPGFTILTVLILSLGIGALTTVFTLVNAVVLKPLPVWAPEELVWLRNPSFSFPVLREIRERQQIFQRSLRLVARGFRRALDNRYRDDIRVGGDRQLLFDAGRPSPPSAASFRRTTKGAAVLGVRSR
jgi:hypothetical protein